MTSTALIQKSNTVGFLSSEDSNNKQLIMNNFHQMLDSELEKMPFTEKESLVKAKENAPQVLAEESYQTVFLHFHNFQATKAAEHLARFWSLRAKLFNDREFMHMNQLGTGTLTRIDIKTLETGFLMVLPFDCAGNYVLAYDPSKSAGCTVTSQRRCFFYMLCHVVKEQSLQGLAKQINFLVLMNKNEAERPKDKRFFADILKVFPIKLAEIHVILEAAGLSDTGYREQAMAKVDAKFDLPPDHCVIHSILPSLSICDELSVYGYRNDNIPVSIGGSWSEQSFRQWRDQVLVNEERKSQSLIPQGQGSKQVPSSNASWQKQTPSLLQSNNKRKRNSEVNSRTNMAAAILAAQKQKKAKALEAPDTSNFAAQLASMPIGVNQGGGITLPINLVNSMKRPEPKSNAVVSTADDQLKSQQPKLSQPSVQPGTATGNTRSLIKNKTSNPRIKKQKSTTGASAFPGQRGNAGVNQWGTNEKKQSKKKSKKSEKK